MSCHHLLPCIRQLKSNFVLIQLRESVLGSLCPPPDDSVDSMQDQEEEDYDAVDEDDRYGFLPSSVLYS